MKEINIDEKLAGQKMMRCLERYLSNAPKSFLYKMLRKKNITLNNSKATSYISLHQLTLANNYQTHQHLDKP